MFHCRFEMWNQESGKNEQKRIESRFGGLFVWSMGGLCFDGPSWSLEGKKIVKRDCQSIIKYLQNTPCP